MSSNKIIAMTLFVFSLFILISFGEDYSYWQYSKNIVLNTSSNGAGVIDDFENLPVLIRLDASNFNFSEANNRGSDVCFSTSNGTRLISRIESWNIEKKTAEVLVLLKELSGNNNTQYIKMYWGKKRSSTVIKQQDKISNSGYDSSLRKDYSNVFKSEEGSMGICHLEGINELSESSIERGFIIIKKEEWKRKLFASINSEVKKTKYGGTK